MLDRFYKLKYKHVKNNSRVKNASIYSFSIFRLIVSSIKTFVSATNHIPPRPKLPLSHTIINNALAVLCIQYTEWPMANQITGINPPSPAQNGRHFADGIFKCIFMNEKYCILIRISLKFVPKGPIDNTLAWV